MSSQLTQGKPAAPRSMLPNPEPDPSRLGLACCFSPICLCAACMHAGCACAHVCVRVLLCGAVRCCVKQELRVLVIDSACPHAGDTPHAQP